MKKNKKRMHPLTKRQPQTVQKTITAAPPRNLTPTLCRQLQQELVTACTKVAEKHGLTIECGELDNIDLSHSFDIGFRITAINPNRPKYPISAVRVADGKGFKFTPENIAMYLQHSRNSRVHEMFHKTPKYAASSPLGLFGAAFA